MQTVLGKVVALRMKKFPFRLKAIVNNPLIPQKYSVGKLKACKKPRRPNEEPLNRNI